ncbi:iron chelate uptake ABC transporter family permease subunit [Alkalihalobacterium chitinilyticum]|uniref:Iron chelate uptake ABC transporter family permease subunit n=1 Tax=Alkalihalobacterium chitinilyticum TaxID=2980103 RepID=A0ABT5VIW2_9BACI|nr:iron chelate uptake ABC transporter family permease subunit [Alkalihalobacterium chitinilyticum]MDE5415391.1 iron chelate uptake ABC transporter family permease subunit [Alkalihalobacterium chitinilyticum]
MSNKTKLIILFLLSLVFTALFIFYNLSFNSNLEYILPRRGAKILAIIVTGAAIAFSTVVFQTITNNRILTPSIIGFDSLYLLIQTFLIFVFGSASFLVMNKQVNFFLSVLIMMAFAGVFYYILFKREGGRNIYFLLLVGIVLGTLFSSISTFMQVLIDPNEFLIVQDRMFASFNNVNTNILGVAIVLFILVTLYFWRYLKYLDVLSLGRDTAVNLGVDYDHVVKRLLILVAILVSISTALVGPILFLGLLVANVTYEFLKTHKHSYIITGAMLISIVALVSGQFLVERVFAFSVPISVIINFIGGVYFIYLLLRGNKSW